MIKVYIFNKSNNVSRFDIFKKFFECVNSKIYLTCCTKADAVYQNVSSGSVGNKKSVVDRVGSWYMI